jgi:hypothetical protein
MSSQASRDPAAAATGTTMDGQAMIAAVPGGALAPPRPPWPPRPRPGPRERAGSSQSAGAQSAG